MNNKNIGDLIRGPFFLLITFFLLSGCNHLFYYPTSTFYIPPKQVGINNYQDVTIKSGDEELHGWYLKSSKKLQTNEKNLILHFHGNAQNLSVHFLNIAWLMNHNYDGIIFDYRGYGLSTGEPDQKGTYEDGLAALNFAYKKFKDGGYQKFIVFAQSLGGIIAGRSLADFEHSNEIDLVFFDSTFTSYKDVAFKKFLDQWLTLPFSPMTYLLLSDEYASSGKIGKIAAKKFLVAHGTGDRIVPFESGKQLLSELEEAGKKVEFWEIDGGRHIDVFSSHGEKYQNKFLSLIEQL